MDRTVRILLVDDDKTALELLSEVLKGRGYDVDMSSSVNEALKKLKEFNYHAIITDLKMPEKSGMALLEYSSQNFPEIPVIMLTAYGTIQSAVEALKNGAYDYISKPVQIDELALTLEKALNHVRLEEENKFLRGELERRDEFFFKTNNKIMEEVFETVDSIKKLKTTILLQGESGTGKEVIAKYIHSAGDSSSEAFVPINCGAIPENLIESELFGYDKGAFTDAKQRTKGKLEIADGGILFMDEIGELPPKAQVALLRFLQDHEITPLGSTRRILLNVRIIAATNKNLKKLVREGKFREDLYYRISIIPISLPPLRERKEDIIPLAEWFTKKFSREYNRKIEGISESAKELLLQYAWPGNIRELRNSIERAVIVTKKDKITIDAFSLETDELKDSYDFTHMGLIPLKELEDKYIQWVLDRVRGNRTSAAEKLKISVRGLRYRLNKKEQ